MNENRTTEKNSNYSDLELLTFSEIINGINQEDCTVAFAVQKKTAEITKLSEAVFSKMKNGGRLFYIGAGTSGRLGIVDASECPPTFGVAFDNVIGIIAGGDIAIRRAVEFAEDDTLQAWKDLKDWNVNSNDFVVGLTASGTTPYVLGGLQKCIEENISTGSISCNLNSVCSTIADFPVEIEVGPEFITGSTRLKSGTAQKMVLNMISTSVMIKLGHVKGNKMIDMQMTNHKLIARGVRFIIEATGADEEVAKQLLTKTGSVRKAIELFYA